jgi:hypothetical protein
LHQFLARSICTKAISHQPRHFTCLSCSTAISLLLHSTAPGTAHKLPALSPSCFHESKSPSCQQSTHSSSVGDGAEKGKRPRSCSSLAATTDKAVCSSHAPHSSSTLSRRQTGAKPHISLGDESILREMGLLLFGKFCSENCRKTKNNLRRGIFICAALCGWGGCVWGAAPVKCARFTKTSVQGPRYRRQLLVHHV